MLCQAVQNRHVILSQWKGHIHIDIYWHLGFFWLFIYWFRCTCVLQLGLWLVLIDCLTRLTVEGPTVGGTGFLNLLNPILLRHCLFMSVLWLLFCLSACLPLYVCLSPHVSGTVSYSFIGLLVAFDTFHELKIDLFSLHSFQTIDAKNVFYVFYYFYKKRVFYFWNVFIF